MPTGTSLGKNKTLDNVSHNKTNIAPKIAVKGTNNLKSFVITFIVMCGTIKPTNPSSPAILTAPEAAQDANIIVKSLVLFTLTPNDCAISSPKVSMFILLAINKAPINPITIYGRAK